MWGSERTDRVVNRPFLEAQILSLAGVFALALFLPAGTVSWTAGWVYLLLFFSFVSILSRWLLQNNPSLLKERMTGFTSDQKSWDKIFILVTGILFFSWLVLMPLDAVRFRWSSVPVWLQVVGAAILVGSFIVFFVTFRENSYLSPVVRIQEERGQVVVSTGLYQYVRHPMYAGFGLFAFGTSLVLGSWYGLLGGLILVGVVARRAVLEERVLRKELPGYASYMARVTYRLVPHVW